VRIRNVGSRSAPSIMSSVYTDQQTIGKPWNAMGTTGPRGSGERERVDDRCDRAYFPIVSKVS
jgi:hypothetical protein